MGTFTRDFGTDISPDPACNIFASSVYKCYTVFMLGMWMQQWRIYGVVRRAVAPQIFRHCFA